MRSFSSGSGEGGCKRAFRNNFNVVVLIRASAICFWYSEGVQKMCHVLKVRANLEKSLVFRILISFVFIRKYGIFSNQHVP